MELPKFMFVESPELTGASFILSTAEPVILAKVIKLNGIEDMQNFKDRTIESFKFIDGYRIAVQYYSNIPTGTQNKATESTKNALNAIASFYFKTRIEPKISFYKRYLITQI